MNTQVEAELRHQIVHLCKALEEESIDSSSVMAGECIFEAEVARLHRLIRKAPHDESCSFHGVRTVCDCWKREALGD